MTIDVCDELNEVSSFTPEEIAGLGEGETTNHQFGDHDDDPDDTTLVVPDDDTKKLLAKCAVHGVRFRSISKEIDAMRPDILALKQKFGVKQGYIGKRLVIDERNSMVWNEYCLYVFGVTAGQMNRLLNASDDKADNVVPPDPRQSKNYKLGLQDAQGAHAVWKRKQLAAGTIFKSDCALPASVPETKPAFDKPDPYAYWEQFREEPETLSGELVAMLVELGLDYQQMLRVAELMKKQAKAQVGQAQDTKKTKAAKAA